VKITIINEDDIGDAYDDELSLKIFRDRNLSMSIISMMAHPNVKFFFSERFAVRFLSHSDVNNTCYHITDQKLNIQILSVGTL